MKVKQKTAIKVYLFTAAIFLTALWRFATEEKLSTMTFDNERIESVSIISENALFYEDSSEVFSYETCFSEYTLPLDKICVTSSFGYRTDPFEDSADMNFHSGIDLATDLNSQVKVVLNGTVLAATYDEIGGNYIMVEHDNNFVSYYGHLAEINVSVGEKVVSGQIIGLSGESGKVTGPHLHFGLYYKENPVDPDVYFDFEQESSLLE